MNTTRSIGHRILGFLALTAGVTFILPATGFGLDNQEPAKGSGEPMKYAIVIHGGAGSSPKNFTQEANESRYAAMQRALEIGTGVLESGGSSLDAVEKVIVFLEDDPQFNAGKGSVFNATGGHELDASIMDGSNKACGAVAGVQRVKNPISLARLVMTETRHVLLAADGAEVFAKRMEVALVEPTYFDTPATLEKWKKLKAKESEDEASWKQRQPIQELDTGIYIGTVGCVALDSDGNLAAGTSTGGMTNKRFGRIGDSPIVGAGTYADNDSCAVSCTGIGEEFIRNAVAYDVSARMKYSGSGVEQAVSEILNQQLKEGDGGIIAVDKHGNITMQFNTQGMARAAADSKGRFEVHWHK